MGPRARRRTAWAAGALVVPDGCAAIAEPAIKLVASSAAANLVNIVFSFSGAWGFAPIVPETLPGGH